MVTNKDAISTWLRELQDSICTSLEKLDGNGKFAEDNWERPEGGGGRTRIFRDGHVIAKGGVNFSAVHGDAPEFLIKEAGLNTNAEPLPKFYATGVSIVIHPVSPMVPIIHMNIRYFEMGDAVRWLGGGIDLTPHYVDEDDAKFFHTELKKVCYHHHPQYYQNFKKWADSYFFIPHRGEARGIGGIFFDRLSEDEQMSFEKNLAFWKDVGTAFVPIYTELVIRSKEKKYSERQRQWQQLRRGRYVEFNLIYDRGTKFGLQTNGRVESILMSLPPIAGWEYDMKPEPGSAEETTLNLLRKPRQWVRS